MNCLCVVACFPLWVICLLQGWRFPNHGLDIIDGVGGLDVQRNRFSGQSFDKDLHPPTKAQHQVKRRLLLDVVIGKRALELLANPCNKYKK